MTTEPQTSPEPPPSSAPSLAMWVMFVVLAAAILSLWMAKSARPTRSHLIGRPAPDLKVEGWLNGPGPTPDDLAGKIVVIDAWAYWCGYCKVDAPHLIQLYEKYKDRGVVFVGLTNEDSSSLDLSRAYLEETGITWPQGYGAGETLEELESRGYPDLFVIDRDGRLAWDMTSRESIEEVLDRLTRATK